MAVLSKGQTFSTGDQVTAEKLNDLVDDATFIAGAVDNASTQLSGGAIIVKDDGVTTAKINDDAVTTAKINDEAVTTDKIEDGAVTVSKLATNPIALAYPVGSIYINASDATNPSTLLGFGTWVTFGAGRVPVGINADDTDFDTAEETGGAKTHTLIASEMPAHTHNSNVRLKNSDLLIDGALKISVSFGSQRVEGTTGGSGVVSTTTGSTGSGQSHNNLQPYIVVYMWKRTA